MYKRNLRRFPQEIARGDFIDLLFKIRDVYAEHITHYDILMIVEAADRFVSSSKEKISASSRIYSTELAYILTILAEKFSHDTRTIHIHDIEDDIENGILITMEREIYKDLDYFFSRKNVYLLTELFNLTVVACSDALAKKIANDKIILYANPITLILAIKMLRQRNKLPTDPPDPPEDPED